MTELINEFARAYPNIAPPLMLALIAIVGGWLWWAIDNLLPKRQ